MDARRKTAVTMLEYHAWATAKTIESVEPLSHEELTRDMRTSHSGVFGTLAHTYGADWAWLKRLRDSQSPARNDLPAVDTLDELRTAWSRTQAEFISFAGGLDDAEWGRNSEYRTMAGAEARSPLYESLLHVVNHGTYHRGQVVTMLRQMGAEPIATDFVKYLRETAPER